MFRKQKKANISAIKFTIFQRINKLPVRSKKYKEGIKESKDRLGDIFLFPLEPNQYLGMIDASLYVLIEDVPTDLRYKEEDDPFYEAVFESFSIAKEELEKNL